VRLGMQRQRQEEEQRDGGGTIEGMCCTNKPGQRSVRYSLMKWTPRGRPSTGLCA
jgi:hypothetical protein